MLREASSAHRTLQNAYRQHKRNFHSLMFMFFINKQSKKNGNVFILCVECVVFKVSKTTYCFMRAIECDILHFQLV